MTNAFFYQDLPTAMDQSYYLTFWLDMTFGGPNELEVVWGGSIATDIVNVSGASLNTFIQYTVPGLIATSTTTRLEFFGRNDPSQVYIDDIAVNTVPEPAAIWLVGPTLLVLARALRRRSRSRL